MNKKLMTVVLGALVAATCGPDLLGCAPQIIDVGSDPDIDAGSDPDIDAGSRDDGRIDVPSPDAGHQDAASLAPTCGDGVMEGQEECDNGLGNSDTAPNACRLDCTLPSCGDGVIDPDNEEECDAGEGNVNTPEAACQRNCRVPSIVSLGVSARYYNIVSDNNDAVHMVWVEGILGNNVYYGQIVDGAVPNRELTPAAGVNSTKHRPSIGVKPDGSEVHFTWVSPNATEPYLIKDCWRSSSGVWSTDTVHDFSPAGRSVQFPSIVVDLHGVAHCTASDWTMANTDMPIAYFRKPAGGVWTRQGDLASATEHNRESTMFVDPAGGVHVTWTIDKLYLKYRYAPSGGNLANSPTLDVPDDHLRNRWSEIFVDRQDNVHLVSLSYENPGSLTFANHTSMALGASAFPMLVDTSAEPFTTLEYIPSPVVGAVSENGVAVALVEMFSNVHYQTKVDGAWATYTLDETAAVLEHSRVVMATTQDSAHLVWRGGDGTLRLATYALLDLSVTSPGGGESWPAGSPQTITWNAAGLSGDVKLLLYKNDVRVGTIATQIPATQKSYSWAVGSLVGEANAATNAGYRIRIRTADGRLVDQSDGDFSIVSP